MTKQAVEKMTTAQSHSSPTLQVHLEVQIWHGKGAAVLHLLGVPINDEDRGGLGRKMHEVENDGDREGFRPAFEDGVEKPRNEG